MMAEAERAALRPLMLGLVALISLVMWCVIILFVLYFSVLFGMKG